MDLVLESDLDKSNPIVWSDEEDESILKWAKFSVMLLILLSSFVSSSILHSFGFSASSQSYKKHWSERLFCSEFTCVKYFCNVTNRMLHHVLIQKELFTLYSSQGKEEPNYLYSLCDSDLGTKFTILKKKGDLSQQEMSHLIFLTKK